MRAERVRSCAHHLIVRGLKVARHLGPAARRNAVVVRFSESVIARVRIVNDGACTVVVNLTGNGEFTDIATTHVRPDSVPLRVEGDEVLAIHFDCEPLALHSGVDAEGACAFSYSIRAE